MNIHITRVDTTLPLPEYQTEGAVGFDLLARTEVTIPAHGYGLVPNNIIVVVPEGYMLMIASRSSTLKKTGLMVGNGVGIIDADYHGAHDEIHTLFYNTSAHDVVIGRGERLSQGIFVKIDRGTWQEEKRAIKEESRGGFGSTDTQDPLTSQ